MRLKAGTSAPHFYAVDINDNLQSIESFLSSSDANDHMESPSYEQEKHLLLSFYRYASCPFCNLRIHEIAKRAAKYRQRGLEIIAVFQSSTDKVFQYVGKQQPPFPIIPDPDRSLYQLYGVESSWSGMAKAFIGRIPEISKAISRGFTPGSMEGEKHRLPADFIINRNGIILNAYYGEDIGDHLSFEEIERYLE